MGGNITSDAELFLRGNHRVAVENGSMAGEFGIAANRSKVIFKGLKVHSAVHFPCSVDEWSRV